jgi:hypothetical protein
VQGITRWQAYVHLDSRRGASEVEEDQSSDYICVRAPLHLSHRGVLGVVGLGGCCQDIENNDAKPVS